MCTLENVLWINNPLKNHRAENKILQLRLASKIGFNIPKTCITSSKEKALEFSRDCGNQIIAKALSIPLVEYPEKDFFIFTNKVSSIETFTESEFKLAPTIFQEAITPKSDYRITVVGKNCFAVKIESPDNMAIPIDWRLDKRRLKYTSVKIPSDVEAKCFKLVKDLGLVFGAIDLIETKGSFYFLEINPNGEWGWLQKEANLPIAESLANILISCNGVQ